mmetsp:Transcript_7714/g.22062  ORF Transcript_7714/g.22062 Transcript_7714/m.22062 type:complete len:1078 (-) Transcript_7714:592-3825(-)
MGPQGGLTWGSLVLLPADPRHAEVAEQRRHRVDELLERGLLRLRCEEAQRLEGRLEPLRVGAAVLQRSGGEALRRRPRHLVLGRLLGGADEARERVDEARRVDAVAEDLARPRVEARCPARGGERGGGAPDSRSAHKRHPPCALLRLAARAEHEGDGGVVEGGGPGLLGRHGRLVAEPSAARLEGSLLVPAFEEGLLGVRPEPVPLEVVRLPEPVLGRRLAALGLRDGEEALEPALGDAGAAQQVEERLPPLGRRVVDEAALARARHGDVKHLELLAEDVVSHRVEGRGAAVGRRRPGRRLVAVERAEDGPRALARRVGEEVEDADVVELEALALLDGEDEPGLQQRRQLLFGRGAAHDDHLVRAHLAQPQLVPREHHLRDARRRRIGQEGGRRAEEVAALVVEPVERGREELCEERDERVRGGEDARVSAVVGDELRGLRAAVKQQPHVGEAEADAARDGLRRVAADKEAVLVGRGVVQQRQLRHGQILHLVDDDAVQRRVPDLALALREEVEDDVAHVVQPVPPLLAQVVLEGVVGDAAHLGGERRHLARQRDVLVAREVALLRLHRLAAALDVGEGLAVERAHRERAQRLVPLEELLKHLEREQLAARLWRGVPLLSPLPRRRRRAATRVAGGPRRAVVALGELHVREEGGEAVASPVDGLLELGLLLLGLEPALVGREAAVEQHQPLGGGEEERRSQLRLGGREVELEPLRVGRRLAEREHELLGVALDARREGDALAQEEHVGVWRQAPLDGAQLLRRRRRRRALVAAGALTQRRVARRAASRVRLLHSVQDLEGEARLAGPGAADEQRGAGRLRRRDEGLLVRVEEQRQVEAALREVARLAEQLLREEEQPREVVRHGVPLDHVRHAHVAALVRVDGVPLVAGVGELVVGAHREGARLGVGEAAVAPRLFHVRHHLLEVRLGRLDRPHAHRLGAGRLEEGASGGAALPHAVDVAARGLVAGRARDEEVLAVEPLRDALARAGREGVQRADGLAAARHVEEGQLEQHVPRHDHLHRLALEAVLLDELPLALGRRCRRRRSRRRGGAARGRHDGAWTSCGRRIALERGRGAAL